MVSNLKQTFFTNWTFLRWLRLGLGLFVSYQAVLSHDVLAGFVASILLLQAVTNTGCCGTRGCSVSGSSKNDSSVLDVEYEEIKSSKVK